MNEKLTQNNIVNNEFNLSNEEHYKDLITKLKEMRITIALLEKQYCR